MRLSFHGADRGVTGSCHLVECAGHRILIDCGLFQGARELDQENAGPFGFDAAQIDYVLLTHAHLDHCGRLPLLTKRGFHGEIITTGASRELARLVLLDAARLQEEDARYRAHRAARQNRQDQASEPLYSVANALNSLEYFGRTASYGQPLELVTGIHATFVDAGHILGSASILLELDEGAGPLRVLFSGDLGNAGQSLLLTPASPPRADIVVMEATYGDRLHKPLGSSTDELFGAITDTSKRGGNVIIPAFALERAQELLFILHGGIAQRRLATETAVYLDSPMAISATEIFVHHPECYGPQTAAQFRDGSDPFSLPGLHLTRETAASVALNDIKAGAIIIAGSGMCTGGRILHHLRHNLWRPECSVIFVGYAAKGTLARQIIDGARTVRIFGEEIAVRAHTQTINGFSAHADQAGLLAWHRQTSARRTFLTHGEENTMQQLSVKLKNTQVEMPVLNQAFDL